jgi:surface protein
MKSKAGKWLLVLVMIVSIFVTSGMIKVNAASDSNGYWNTVEWEFDADTGVLTFTSGGEIPALRYPDNRSWKNNNATDVGEAIKKIVFEQSVTLPTDSAGLFGGLSNLEVIDGLDKLDLSNVKSMHGMFVACPNLKSIDGLENWDISNVTRISNMFNGCKSIESMEPLTNWNTMNIKDVSNMFTEVELKNIDFLRNWDTRNFTNISALFSSNLYLENIDALINWNVSNVTLANGVFSSCKNLKSVDGLKDWDLRKVTEIQGMFSSCTSLETIDALANWNLESVTDIDLMFINCTNLKNANALVNWNVSNVTTMKSMVNNCVNLESINLTTWSTKLGNNYTTSGMFIGCNNLQSITLGENMIFSDSTNLPTIDTISGNYTGEWIGLNTNTVYSSSDSFMTEYDGGDPDTFVWKNTSHSVTYEFVSGTSGMILPATVTELLPSSILTSGKYSSEVIHSPLLTNVTVSVPNGTWVFQGWDKEVVTISEADVIVTGTWIYTADPDVNTYSVTYHSNTDDSGVTEYKISGIIEDATHTVVDASHPSLGYSKDEYGFKGWNTQADGLGRSYVAGEIITVQEDTHLYAQWKLLSSVDDPKSMPPSIAGASTNTVNSVDTGVQTNTQSLTLLLLASLGLLSGFIITLRKKTSKNR